MKDGFYTVVGSHGHYTFRVETQPDGVRFAPGKQIIGYLNGPDNYHSYQAFGFVDGIVLRPWKRFQSGYDRILAAAKALVGGSLNAMDQANKDYALESGNCYVCNRMLTTPESIELGIGPVCASKRNGEREERG